jgi:hypothetical protein
LALDGIEKADEFLMPVALHAAPDDLAFKVALAARTTASSSHPANTTRQRRPRLRRRCRRWHPIPPRPRQSTVTSPGSAASANTALTDERSTEVGYGPVCAKHYGLPWGVKPALKAAA